MAEERIFNEVMSIEELDNVAGGNRVELALDTKLFKDLGYLSKSYTSKEINNGNVNEIAAQVKDLWNKFGFHFEYKDFEANVVRGRGADTRDAAIRALLKQSGYGGEIAPEQYYTHY